MLASLATGIDEGIATCHLKSKLLTFPGGRFGTNDPDERARGAAYALFRRTSEAATLRVHANGARRAGPDRTVRPAR